MMIGGGLESRAAQVTPPQSEVGSRVHPLRSAQSALSKQMKKKQLAGANVGTEAAGLLPEFFFFPAAAFS